MARNKTDDQGHTANDLNAFRRVVRIIYEITTKRLADLLKKHMLRGHGTRAEKDQEASE